MSRQLKTCSTYWVNIYVSGPTVVAEQICRDFLWNLEQCCVTVSILENNYVWKGGEQQGVEVTLINFPRHPQSKEAIWKTATDLAEHLMEGLKQKQVTLVDPEKTLMLEYGV